MILMFLGPFLWFKIDQFQELELDSLCCIQAAMTDTVFSMLYSHYCSLVLKENNHETGVFLYCAWTLLRKVRNASQEEDYWLYSCNVFIILLV